MRKVLPAILAWTLLVAACEGVLVTMNDGAALQPYDGTTDLARDFGLLAVRFVVVMWLVGLVIQPVAAWRVRDTQTGVRGAAFVGAVILTYLVSGLIFVPIYSAIFNR